jgi:hypothetical protein
LVTPGPSCSSASILAGVENSAILPTNAAAAGAKKDGGAISVSTFPFFV